MTLSPTTLLTNPNDAVDYNNDTLESPTTSSLFTSPTVPKNWPVDPTTKHCPTTLLTDSGTTSSTTTVCRFTAD
jgi:hypothetical protein